MRLIAAATIGETRLIDNVRVEMDTVVDARYHVNHLPGIEGRITAPTEKRGVAMGDQSKGCGVPYSEPACGCGAGRCRCLVRAWRDLSTGRGGVILPCICSSSGNSTGNRPAICSGENRSSRRACTTRELGVPSQLRGPRPGPRLHRRLMVGLRLVARPAPSAGPGSPATRRPAQLAADRRRRPADPPTDLADSHLLVMQPGDLVPLVTAQVPAAVAAGLRITPPTSARQPDTVARDTPSSTPTCRGDRP